MSEDTHLQTENYEDLIRLSGQLVRIALTDEEVQTLARNFRDFRQHAETLKQVDVSGVEPATYLRSGQNLRPDRPQESITREEFLNSAPAQENGYLKVAPVLDRPDSGPETRDGR